MLVIIKLAGFLLAILTNLSKVSLFFLWNYVVEASSTETVSDYLSFVCVCLFYSFISI